MNPLYIRILDEASLSLGDTMDLTNALDLARYRELEIVVRVSQAGSGDAPLLVVEHSASNEAGAYLAFSTPVEVDLSVVGNTWLHQVAFTRWVAWRVSGTLSESAVVTLEIVAKA